MNFDNFYKLVKSNLNLDLTAYKEQQLQRRIKTVMNNAGANNLEEYTDLIKNNKEIKDIFLDYITINVTEFFRNREIFEDFENILIKDISTKFNNLNIWSAACSIGAEPYTISMILNRNKIQAKSKILATDIDENVLKKAKNGIYSEREIKGLQSQELTKYFTKKEEEYEINKDLKDIVEFKKHDLILDRYPKDLNVIVCRNVTIYFKNETKDEIYKKMYDSLLPGGILFTGATESIYNPSEFGFKKKSTFIYEKI